LTNIFSQTVSVLFLIFVVLNCGDSYASESIPLHSIDGERHKSFPKNNWEEIL